MESCQPGSRFGELEIVRELGRGAFGCVYLAKDTLVGRSVALKVLRLPGPGSAPDRDALLREARLVGRLRSPHVATLYRVHPLPDGWAFELEYVEGGSLEDLLARAVRPGAAEVRRIAQGVLRGLQDAHEQGIVHGDVKPGNVLLGRDGAVKLVDFGLAHLVGDLSLRATRDEVVGTPAYMAPEVIMGESPTAASDLWSVGVILYRMLAGRHPFPGRTLPALFYSIQNAPPPPLDPGLPPHLVDVTLRCISKQPRDRPASCADVIHDLLPAAVAEPRPAPAARPDRATPQLFGRAPERALLHAAAARVAGGAGAAILLSGQLGMGKSALGADLAAHAAGLGFRWVEARVTAIEGVLRPLLGAVRDLAARPDHVGPVEIETGLFGTATNLLRTLIEGAGAIPLESRQQVAWGLEELFSGLARERPLGIVLEDAHLANAEDWNLLSDLARRLASARVLVCAVAATDTPLPPGGEIFEQVRVGPLDADAISRLLHARADGARLAPEVLRRVLEASEGNPLFAIELFRHLRESGAIARQGDLLGPATAWRATALPRRLKDLALARVAGLPEEQRALLDVAAVDGLAFDGESVAAGAGRPLLDVLRVLQEIYRRAGLITPRATGYRFAHAVLQEGIYEEIAPALRRALHGRLAEHLEARAEASRVLPERLGLHWERAGEAARARPHLLRAALEALRRQDHLRAVDLLGRGGLHPSRLTPEDASAHAELLLEATDTVSALGRHEDAERIFAAVLDAAERAGDEMLRLQTMVRRYQRVYLRQGLVGVDEAALRDATVRLPPTEHRGRAHYLLGMIAKYRGDLDEAERRFKAADGDFAENHIGLHSSALDQLGSVSLRRGRWREAEALYADAARISAIAGRRSNAAVSEINGALASYMRGGLDGLVPRVESAIQKLMVEGAAGQVAGGLGLLSEIQYALGDAVAARRSVDDALRAARRAGSLTAQLTALKNRADLLLAEGDLDGARADVHAARGLAASREDYSVRRDIAVCECRIASVLGDSSQAAASAAEAMRLVRATPPPEAHEASTTALLEAVVYGLPLAALGDAEGLLGAATTAGAAYAGVSALADAAAPAGVLLSAASALRGPEVGPRRATLRVIAALLAAEGRLRAGEAATARLEAEAGLRCAASLGHVWLEAHLLAWLARMEPNDGMRARLASRIDGVAKRLADEAERGTLLRRWRGVGQSWSSS